MLTPGQLVRGIEEVVTQLTEPAQSTRLVINKSKTNYI